MPVVADILSATIVRAKAYPTKWLVELLCDEYPPCLMPIHVETNQTREAINEVFQDLSHETIFLELKDIPASTTADRPSLYAALRRRALTYGFAIGAVMSEQGITVICRSPDAYPQIMRRFPSCIDVDT
eukprot:6468161-Amphidinium_carterae.1